MDAIDTDEARRRLEAERDRLLDVRTAAGHTTTGAQDADASDVQESEQQPQEVVSEALQQELTLSVLQRVDGEIAAVQAALDKLKDGRYGLCEKCGKPIDAARLEAMPAARFCLDDQAKIEHESHPGTI